MNPADITRQKVQILYIMLVNGVPVGNSRGIYRNVSLNAAKARFQSDNPAVEYDVIAYRLR